MALGTGQPAEAAITPSAPIKHVVIVYQENHSFDNVLGRFCKDTSRCDGATRATLSDGQTVRLGQSPDLVPNVGHHRRTQKTAVDGGRMDGFTRIAGCRTDPTESCLTSYRPHQIPNLARLARHFAISDRTFEMSKIPSWGAHIELVAAGLDGFTGDNPASGGPESNWGCDSGHDAEWRPQHGAPTKLEPSCIPDPSLDPVLYPYGGAYRQSDVPYLPTLMDRLDAAGLSWRIYAATSTAGTGYGWAICPTFADCLYTSQHQDQVPPDQVLSDAASGQLPSFSVVIPSYADSQHNGASMAAGDNWIGQVVSAIESGPDWKDTAVFIAYDDCGCFYDHVAPPPHLGIRVPMVIVSPYAKPAYTDSRTASVASLLAFSEHLFGLAPLGNRDQNAYDYARSFDFHQAPQPPVALGHQPISPAERTRLHRIAARPRGGT